VRRTRETRDRGARVWREADVEFGSTGCCLTVPRCLSRHERTAEPQNRVDGKSFKRAARLLGCSRDSQSRRSGRPKPRCVVQCIDSQ
jgi:hypothetical protein